MSFPKAGMSCSHQGTGDSQRDAKVNRAGPKSDGNSLGVHKRMKGAERDRAGHGVEKRFLLLFQGKRGFGWRGVDGCSQ